jgi:peptidyl-prolyl cis-trans isomerase C
MKKLLISFVVCGIVLLGNWDAIAEDPAAVAVRVNDEVILQSEIDLFMNVLALPQLRARNQGKEISPEQKQQVRQDIINQLINQKLILNVASDLKVSLDQKIVNERFEGSKARYQGIAPEKLKQLIENEFLFEETIKRVREEKASKIIVSDEDLRKFYEEQKNQRITQMASQIKTLQQRLESSTNEEEQKILENQLGVLKEQQAAGPFSEPEQIRAGHILVKVEPEGSQEEKDAARKKIADILRQLQEGKNFAELAKAHSDDPGSKDKGGDLGFFGRGVMVKPFEDTVFALPVGGISDVVETIFGYHIITVTDKKAQREVPFEELKDRIKQTILNQKINAEMNIWFGNLRSNAKIEIMSQTN